MKFSFDVELTLLEKRWRITGKKQKVSDEMKKHILNSLMVVDRRELFPHERTIPISKENVKKQMLVTSKFSWPIYVDEVSKVILDGMHRYEAIADLGCEKILIQKIDYKDNPEIKLDVWCRIIDNISPKDLEKIKAEFELIEIDLNDIKTSSHQDIPLIISPSKIAHSFKKRGSHHLDYVRLTELENFLGIANTDPSKTYVLESKITKIAKEGKLITIPPSLKKEDVVKVARFAKGRKDKLFPPKSTRHVFHYRVFNIDLPLELLKSHKNAKTITSELRKLHRKRDLFYLGKDIGPEDYGILDRVYEEHLFMFE